MFSQILVTSGESDGFKHNQVAFLRYEYPNEFDPPKGSIIDFVSKSNGELAIRAISGDTVFSFGVTNSKDRKELLLQNAEGVGSCSSFCENQHFALIDAGWRVDTTKNPFKKTGKPNLSIGSEKYRVANESLYFVKKLLSRYMENAEIINNEASVDDMEEAVKNWQFGG